MNAEKLKRLQAQVRIGGKGTPRRKKKVIHQTATTDDKKLQSSLKKLSVSTIPGIEEVNIIKDDLTVIHFNNPKAQASLSANTFAVTGHGEHKKIVEMLPEILPQLGQETVVQLRMFANSMSSNNQKQESVGVVGVVASSVADEDDVPTLVSDFDEIAKVEAASEAKPAAPKQTCNESTKVATIGNEPKNLNEGNVQNERDNNQIEEKAEEQSNINVAAIANPLDTANTGKKPKKEEQSQSKEGKANSKTKKIAKDDAKSLHHEENRKVSDKTGKDIKQKDAVEENKQSQQVVKPTGVKKITEEATLIVVDQTPNSSVESIKCSLQEELKDMGTEVMVPPLKENQTKKQDKPKEQITSQMGKNGKETEQGKIKDQENKEQEDTSSTTKEIEIEMKVKKDQAPMVAVAPKEERVQKQKSPLKSGGKQKAFVAVEEKVKQPSPQDKKSGALGTNILQSSNKQEFVKDEINLELIPDKNMNETKEGNVEKAITTNDIKKEGAIQGKASSAQVINLQSNNKVKIDEQENLQEPNNEITKKEEITQAYIQIDESVTKLIESTKDVVPQEHAPTKPTSQDKRPDEISSYPTSVNIQINKNDTNTQAQGEDINSNKSQLQQPNDIKKESPEIQDKMQSKDIEKETSTEKSKKEEMTQVKTAATFDDIMAIGNPSHNQQPQSEPHAQQRIEDSKPTNPGSPSVVENQIKPATDIIKQMVEQVPKELKIMDTSTLISDKPTEPNEGTRNSQLTENIEVILKESVPKAQLIEVKAETNIPDNDILKDSAPEINQKKELTGSTAVQVTAPKPAEIKEIAVKSDEDSIKTSTQNVSQIMGANINEPADEVLTPEPPEVKQKITKDGVKCFKGIIEDGSQAKEVDINPRADQVHQDQVGAEEPQTIRTDNIIVECAAPQLKDSPPRQNANKKTTPQPQDKEGAKQQQNKPVGGGKKATAQSEGKRPEASKPKQTSPIKTQHQQQAAKQPGGNASKQQQQQGKASAGGTSTKATENPVVASKPGTASPQPATPPKAASPTKSVAATLTTTPAPIQSMKSPFREVGGNKSTASAGKKQNQKEGAGGNKAKQPSSKVVATSAAAAASAGVPVEKTGKPASPLKATEPVATPPHARNQPNVN